VRISSRVVDWPPSFYAGPSLDLISSTLEAKALDALLDGQSSLYQGFNPRLTDDCILLPSHLRRLVNVVRRVLIAHVHNPKVPPFSHVIFQ